MGLCIHTLKKYLLRLHNGHSLEIELNSSRKGFEQRIVGDPGADRFRIHVLDSGEGKQVGTTDIELDSPAAHELNGLCWYGIGKLYILDFEVISFSHPEIGSYKVVVHLVISEPRVFCADIFSHEV